MASRVLSDYIGKLLSKYKDIRVKKNIMLLIAGIVRQKNLKVYNMASEKREYEVFTGLLGGEQVNTLSATFTLACVKEHTTEHLGSAHQQFVLHDGCDLRKADSRELEHLGHVMSLSKQVIRGYKTMNAVIVDAETQALNLLCHEVYSNKMPTYIGETILNNPKLSKDLTVEQQRFVVEKAYINTKVLFHKNLKASSDYLKAQRPGGLICHIADREFDDDTHFEYIDQLGDEFVIRLKTNRLSNQVKTVYTLSGKVSKRVAYQALVDKPFAHRSTSEIEKITFHGQTYSKVTVQVDWETLVLNEKTYSVVRITLRQGTKPLFEQPMLLITNRKITTASQAHAIYSAYLLRSKIEVVFKFLKQNLGWETFQVRDFNKIKNLLALAFFLVGFFSELEEELKKHPLAQNLCELAHSKGLVTIHFLLQGLERLVHFQEVTQWMQDENLSKEDIDDLLKTISTGFNSA
jgi:Transposase DDE domain